MTRRLAVLFILLAACFAASGVCQGQASKIPVSYRETATFVAEGAAKGMVFPAVVAMQHAKGVASWKRVYGDETPPHFESNRFLVYGIVPGKTLKDVGAALEKQYALAVRVLELEDVEPWAGKLAAFCLPDRAGFVGFVRAFEQRRVEPEDQGTYDVDDDFPYVAAGPAPRQGITPADVKAGEQMVAALVTKKGGRTVPEWIQLAFGRATVYRAASAKELAAEHKRALSYLTKNRRALKDILPSGGATDEEAAVLRASVLEYLAYSGRTSKFLPFLSGFRVIDEKVEPTFTNGLLAANLTQDGLDQVWQKWLRSFK